MPSQDAPLLQGALHDKHVAAGARMVDEAGWEVPLSYGGVPEEVATARRRAGVFDISHLGRLRIRGDGALALLERLCTADVAHQEDNTALHSLLCNPRGGILDDGLLLRAEDFWLLTTSAGNRGKILQHLQEHAADFDVKIDDQTERTTHLAVVGPQAPALLDASLPIKPSGLPRGAILVGSLMIARYVALRVGYCNEWALEVILPNMVAGTAWRFITEKAGENRVAPAALAARDVLRIESGLRRYGHEINETVDPIAAGLGALVDFGHDFLGADAVREAARRAAGRKIVGIVFTPRGEGQETLVPQQALTVLKMDGAELGTVTSGTFSPTLQRPIALASVAAEAGVGQEVQVDVGGQRHGGRIVELPFCRTA